MTLCRVRCASRAPARWPSHQTGVGSDGGDTTNLGSAAAAEAQTPPSRKTRPAVLSLAQEVPRAVGVGSASPGAGLGGAGAGRTSSAESLAPPQGCASTGVTNPGPSPQPIAQRERQEPGCHLPQPREPWRGRLFPAWGQAGAGAGWISHPESLAIPARCRAMFCFALTRSSEYHPCRAAGPNSAPASQTWAARSPLV